MLRVLHCLTLDHDQRLVLLAGAICVVGVICTLIVANRAVGTQIPRLWLALLSICAGATVWATHFIAMLAYRTGVTVTYGVGLTVLSFVLGVAVMGLGFLVAIRWHRLRSFRLLGGGILGVGVVLLHYVGMAALQLPGVLTYSTDLVVASVVLSVALGALALDAAFGGRSRRSGFVAGALFVAMILSLHFTAMGALELSLGSVADGASRGMSRPALAGAVSAASLMVLLIGLAGAIVDQRVSLSLGKAAARFEALADGAFEGLIVHRNGVVTDANAAARRMFAKPDGAMEYSIDDWFGRTMAFELQRKAEDDPDTTAEVEMLRPDGSRFPAEVRLRRIRLEDDADGALLAIRDLTARKESEDKIRHLALHDPLTDLPNRRFFMELADGALVAAQGTDKSVAALAIDIDSFKLVNDVYGHATGDELIRVVGARIVAMLSPGDVAARFGGDEFAVLQVSANQPRAAMDLAQRLLGALKAPVQLGLAQLSVSISIGVARHPDDGATTEELLRNADTAMYSAKADGKAACRLFTKEMDAALDARRRFESRLRRAVVEERLKVFYQPVVDSETRRPLGFEALLRWYEEDLGWVSPADCIPVAEETGLIVPIGEFMLRRACMDAASWPAPLRVAVNLSAVQFRRGGLVETVQRALADSGLPGDRLELEVTETVLLESQDETLRILTALKALGVRIAMDDFGTGYSSLGYLQRFSFDKIKIDRVFVSNLQSSAQSASIIQAVMTISESMQMRVVAEGVETDLQAHMLKDMQCHELQGFLISKPMPFSEVGGFLGRCVLPAVSAGRRGCSID